MKLLALAIDRFGSRRNLRLDGLKPQLNVVVGPNGSGKSTIMQFVRWMLYGEAEAESRAFVVLARERVGGSLELLDDQQRRRRITRHRGPDGRTELALWAGDRQLTFEPSSELLGVDADEFRHIFCFSLEQPPAMDDLLRVARKRGWELTHDERQLDHLRLLRERLAELRTTLAGHSPAHESWQDWQTRRMDTEAEIEQAKQLRNERLRSLETRLDHLRAEIASVEQRLASEQDTLHRVESLRNELIEHLEQMEQRARLIDADVRERTRRELDELDQQVERWQQILQSVQQRHRELQCRLEPMQTRPMPSLPENEQGWQFAIDTLNEQIHQLQRDLTVNDDTVQSVAESRMWDDAAGLRKLLALGLADLHDNLAAVTKAWQQRDQSARYHQQTRELDRIGRCETELRELIELLEARRTQLCYQAPAVEPSMNDAPGRITWLHSGQQILRERIEQADRHCREADARVLEFQRQAELLQSECNELRRSREHLAEDREIDRLREQLHLIEEQATAAERVRRQQDDALRLEKEIEKLQQNLAPSQIAQEASAILHRMTEGAYQRIRVSDRRQIWVEDAVGHAYDFRELSRGTRDQVYLALALALASAYRRSGIHVPMLLGDLFQNIDSDRAWSTAEVLGHFCTQDHQMVVLTRHEHVERLLSRYGARAFRLRPRDPRDDVGGHSHAAGHVERPGPKSPSLPDIPSPRARTDADLPWQTHWQAARVDASRVDKVPLEMVRPMASPGSPDAKVQKTERSGAAPAIPDDHLAADTASDPPPKIPGQRPGNGQASSDPSESIGWIREETDLHDVPLLEKDMTHHLRSHGVRTVGDFLSLTPEAGADYLATWNISATRVYRLQAQLSLQCYVGLSALDAALLVECGIDDPEDLSYIDTDELYHRIEERLANSEARSRYGSILRYERPRLARWIERARGCHYRRTLQAGRTRQPIPRPSSPLQKPRPASTPRATTPHEPATVAPMPPTAPSGQEGEARNETLRFYLEPADPVVDAPSIGPKTAERLHAVGIRTIADLLSSDPVKTAEEIDYRRITAELVATWQRQAQLVCRVPNLRGHDAQMLVACGVDSAESLARSTADSLLEAVTRFIRTSEGKRVLRNGRAPDATEVHSWIRWASHARTLEKAQP